MNEERKERIASALAWIAGRLRELEVPFQVVGGLAALAHGASRDLADIDVYVPEGALERLLPVDREDVRSLTGDHEVGGNGR